jgi:glycosyltransferase involved in cell wall biosynthesis
MTDLSIIVPIYNAEKTIRDCILSILNSDFDKNFEVIIVDDGSTDDSIERIKDLNLKIIRQENRGAAAARNKGAKYSKSDLIIFVDSDVVFLRDTMKRIYGHLSNETVDYVSIKYSKRPINQKWIHKYKALADHFYYYDAIFTKEEKNNPIKQVSLNGGVESYKKSVFEELGGFDENIKGADIEREKLVFKLYQNYNMVADGSIESKHNFPDFKPLVKKYFLRTLHSMNLIYENKFMLPYSRKNIMRIALGPAVLISLFFSLYSLVIFSYTFPILFTLLMLLSYILIHRNLYILAFKEYGFPFMVYIIMINFFFSNLIALAGLFGVIKNLCKI